ncbi:uncharacterized protein DFL_002399 [Arthrobotrys flagrans]|uniref:Uncharacterized protein n=1 Tax=Arthrobotrys flagrans TaxID=97331 RepID=A0A437AAD6_ARTFL|nr:hypothetical protein DFL_002399 [Arthrobotrys flagrans]
MQVSRLLAIVFFLGSTSLAAPLASPDALAAPKPNPAVYNPWEHIRKGGKLTAGNKPKREIRSPSIGNLLPDILRPTAGQELEDRRRSRYAKREDPPAVTAPAPAPVADEVATKGAKGVATAKGAKLSGIKFGGVKTPDLPGKVKRYHGQPGEKRDRRFNPGSFPPRKSISNAPGRV